MISTWISNLFIPIPDKINKHSYAQNLLKKSILAVKKKKIADIKKTIRIGRVTFALFDYELLFGNFWKAQKKCTEYNSPFWMLNAIWLKYNGSSLIFYWVKIAAISTALLLLMLTT